MLQSDENIFSTLSKALSEGILVIDENQQIVATNSSVEEIFGYDKDELIKKQLDTLIPQSYHSGHSDHFKKYFDHSVKRKMGQGRELFGLKKCGAIFPVEVGLNPFTIYGKTFIMALVMDISVRKEQEREIQELNTRLEEKITERTKKLHTTIKDLEEEVRLRKKAEAKIKESLKKERDLNVLKTKFLSLVSHEFKTPLSGILTSATLAKKYTKSEQQKKRDKHIDIIKNKVKYLNNILNDFLTIERLETGKVSYKFTTFPLSKVVNEVVYDANMLLKTGQQINYPKDIDDYIINFDEKILELTLTNLINNAIKYSGENTVIDLFVSIENAILIFEIVDQGIGIPEKEQKYIFNRYFRAENALLDQGTGIGLNIVKTHLESLGGDITFTSELNKGSTFIVRIPIINNHTPL